MKRIGIWLCCVALSSAAASQSPVFSATQRADGEAQVAKAGRLLADTLRDTSAAKFRDVFLRKTIGKDGHEYVSVCGEVNSKNGFGGISGFHKFMLVGDSVYVGGSGQIINADEICDNGRAVVDTHDYSAELRKAFDARAGQ